MTEKKYLHNISNQLSVLYGCARRLDKYMSADPKELDLVSIKKSIEKLKIATDQILDLTKQRKDEYISEQ